MPESGRSLDAYSRSLFSDGLEIFLNPDEVLIAKTLAKVQGRSRKNRLTTDEAQAVLLRVTLEGASSAHAGFKDCPRNFKYGVTSTVMQVARLTDSIIGCVIGRQLVLPGEKGRPLVTADPFDKPREWLKQIVSTFWTCLDDRQIADIQQKAVSMAMELAATQDWRSAHVCGAKRAGVRRKLQLDALFRSVRPVYMPELKAALGKIDGELSDSREDKITWRAFQTRWPSIAVRYKRDLLELFKQGAARRQDLAEFHVGSPKYSLSFATWSGEQMVFPSTQIVFQVCSSQLSIAEGAGHRSTFKLRRALFEAAEFSPHPVTPETVGWFRVHLDDLHRLAFVDEVQSDVMEHLLACAAQGDTAAQLLAKDLADWQVNGFTSIRHWATAIGYRIAMHSEESATAIADKSKSARKWNIYYGALIKRFGLTLQARNGYSASILIGD
jgi:hypothetical protein